MSGGRGMEGSSTEQSSWLWREKGRGVGGVQGVVGGQTGSWTYWPGVRVGVLVVGQQTL